MGSTFEIQLTYHGDLTGFLSSRMRGKFPIVRQLREKTAVEDVIEACGVPHPEIDLIVVSFADPANSFSVDFRWQAVGPSRIDAYGFPAPADICRPPRACRPRISIASSRTAIGKACRNLRLLRLQHRLRP